MPEEEAIFPRYFLIYYTGRTNPRNSISYDLAHLFVTLFSAAGRGRKSLVDNSSQELEKQGFATSSFFRFSRSTKIQNVAKYVKTYNQI